MRFSFPFGLVVSGLFLKYYHISTISQSMITACTVHKIYIRQVLLFSENMFVAVKWVKVNCQLNCLALE